MITRHSSDDRKGDPHDSPFRSRAERTRLMAALDMVQKRTTEIAHLENLVANETGRDEKRRLQVRLSATKNNLASWRDYIETNHPHVKGAVITP